MGRILADMTSAQQADAISAFLFYVFAGMSAISAITLVISRNIVRTAVCLLFTLIGVAGLYFLLSAEFLAAVQLVVYAGGTLILIIFGVMLTSKSPFSRFAPKPGEIVISLAIGAVLMVSLVWGINRAVSAGVFGSDAYAADSYPMVALGQALL